MELWQALLTGITGAVIGGLVVHFGAAHRDTVNTRRTQRIDYRIAAYRALIFNSNRIPRSDETARALESAIDDVLLFGTASEVQIAQSFMLKQARSGDGNLIPLADELRSNLRKELKEKSAPLNPEIRVIRFGNE